MNQLCLIAIIFYVYQTECGLLSGAKDGSKESVVESVESNPGKFVLSEAKRGNNWQPHGNWKSGKDYALQRTGKTVHGNYLMNCYQAKTGGKSKVALFFLYTELLEVDVTACDEAKVWKSIRIQEPKQGYHHISVLFKDSCKEYQINMETSLDNGSSGCQRNAGAADWERIG